MYNLSRIRSLLKCKFTVRHFTNNHRVAGQDETTLTGRLVVHVNSLNCLSSNFFNASKPADAKDCDAELVELERVFRRAQKMSKAEKQRTFNQLEGRFLRELSTMETTTIFHVLNLCMNLMPGNIFNLQFYKAAVKYLHRNLSFLSSEEVIQLVFYVGLQKKTSTAFKMIQNCLGRFTDGDVRGFTVDNLCLICNAAFKTSTKITNTVILDKVIDVLNNNLDILNDPAYFVTFVKTLRHNRYQNEDILSTISCTVLFNSTYKGYSFGAMCHVLAVYADYLYYDETILDLFYKSCLDMLSAAEGTTRSNHISETVRSKDVKRFLWAYSLLGYKISEADFRDVIVPKILRCIDEYMEYPENLLDSIYYMWILNYQAVELIPHCFTTENIEYIKNLKSNTKERLNALLVCMRLENVQLFKTLRLKPDKFLDEGVKEQQILKRPYLHLVYNALNALLPRLDLDRFGLEYQIPHLNILGITGYRKIYKTVHVEVLDEFSSVKGRTASSSTSMATGPMQMKLRLLDGMDQALVIIPLEDIKTLSPKELEEYLEDEIKMVC